MSWPLTLGCFWVLAATATALLPMRRQMIPGLALLAAVPVLLVWIGVEHGGWWVLAGVLAFLSMFRRPLIGLARYALGRPVRMPQEFRRRRAPAEERQG